MKDLWVPLSAAIARQRQVETIANNVANANTPGFKKDQLTFKEYIVNHEKGGSDIDLPNKTWKPEDFYRTHNNENSFVKIDGTFTNFEQGDLIPTKNNLDIALRGSGFIEILTPQGLRYTRKGALSISNEGRLITDQGYPVISSRDDYTQNQISSSYPKEKFQSIKKRQIYTNQGPVDKISITEFKDINALKKEGNSMFINPSIENIQNDPVQTVILQAS